jgi:ATPase family associated with various cellular activities (AAA)
MFKPTAEADLDMHQQLPPGNYYITKLPMTEILVLNQIEDFTVPAKLYGNIEHRAERILRTYKDRPNSTGVLAVGEKGSGKTQLARLVAHKAAQLGMPCIIINQPWVGDPFNALIQSITQDCVIMFDEFEKVYDHDEQKKVLTLLDGVFPTKKLFLLTSNDKWLINDHMRNRPGRIYYLLDFNGLKPEFIAEYCEDRLNDKSQTAGIQKIAQMFAAFNFDMLQAMVEEMNRYGESAQDVLDMLNARPTTDTEGTYEVTLTIDGVKVDKGLYYPTEVEGSPMHEQEIILTYHGQGNEAPDEDDEPAVTSTGATASRRRRRPGQIKPGRYSFRQSHLKSFDSAKGEFIYHMPDSNATAKFTRVRYSSVNVGDLF